MKHTIKPNNPKFAKVNRHTILPTKMAIFLNYVQAVTFFSLSTVIAVMLYSYSITDGGWSKSADLPITKNICGLFGAYFSDICYSLFGYSAWWIVAVLFYVGVTKILREKMSPGNLSIINRIIFFIILMVFSSALEFLLNYGINANLPNVYGGVIGSFIIMSSYHQLGEIILSMVILLVTIISFSIVFSIKWFSIAEKVGAIITSIASTMSNSIANKNDNVNSSNYEKVLNNTYEEDSNAPQEINLPIEIEILQKNIQVPDVEINNLDTFNNDNQKIQNEIQDSNLNLDDPFLVHESKNEVKQGIIDDDNIINYRVDDTIESHHKIQSNSAEVFFNKPSFEEPVIVKPIPKHNVDNTFYQADLIHESDNTLPSTTLLHMPSTQQETVSPEVIEFVSRKIETTLADFGIEVTICNVESGPVITRYELTPPRGVKGDKIAGYSKEIARALALPSVRIVENIIGKNTMGIEVPNFKRQTIFLKEVFDSRIYKENNSLLTLALGKDIAGQVVVTDLAKMPHLLVAGTTGSGKSVSVNAMILSILFNSTADEVKFIMIDPKMVELSFYQDIPHLLAPVVTDMSQAANALKWTVGEMERRYKLMAKIGTKKINDFNAKIEKAIKDGKPLFNPFCEDLSNPEPLEKWPFIVVIIDELADLMMVEGKKIEQYIARLAQKARAVGIHLIVATQRPSTDVITGLIKSNIPARISFQLPAAQDSRIILNGQNGAEALLGQGDMLFLAPGSGFAKRIHGAFVNDDELYQIVEYLKDQGAPNYNDEILSGDVDVVIPGLEDDSQGNGYDSSVIEKDPIFDMAVKFILDTKKCSISSLQTQFGIGYNKAARVFAHLEKIGMVRRNDRGGFELLNHTIK